MKQLSDYLYYHEVGPPDIKIYHGDCLEIMPLLDRVDLVVTDPPYGITSNDWDKKVIDMTKLPLPMACFAGQPFSSALVMSMPDKFKHEWIWVKNRGSNFANTVREPMKEHEHIIFFAEKRWTYNKQMQERAEGGNSRAKYNVKFETQSENYRQFSVRPTNTLSLKRVPSSVQLFNTDTSGEHPTIKPLECLRYLVKTYSNESNLILDPFMGSGTTLVACKELKRNGIGIEISEKYCEIAKKRLQNTQVPFL